jgi:hypothetical protein
MTRIVLSGVLVLGLLTFGVGAAIAQDAGTTPRPAPSYQPTPAADPVAAVSAFLDALAAKRWGALPSLACAAERQSVASSFDPAAQTYLSPEVVDALYGGLSVELADASATLGTSDGVTATVVLDGTFHWVLSDAALSGFVDVLAAMASPAPTADEKAQVAQDLRRGLDAQVLAPEVQVVAEDGGWLVCSDVVVEATEPSASPAG